MQRFYASDIEERELQKNEKVYRELAALVVKIRETVREDSPKKDEYGSRFWVLPHKAMETLKDVRWRLFEDAIEFYNRKYTPNKARDARAITDKLVKSLGYPNPDFSLSMVERIILDDLKDRDKLMEDTKKEIFNDVYRLLKATGWGTAFKKEPIKVGRTLEFKIYTVIERNVYRLFDNMWKTLQSLETIISMMIGGSPLELGEPIIRSRIKMSYGDDYEDLYKKYTMSSGPIKSFKFFMNSKFLLECKDQATADKLYKIIVDGIRTYVPGGL